MPYSARGGPSGPRLLLLAAVLLALGTNVAGASCLTLVKRRPESAAIEPLQTVGGRLFFVVPIGLGNERELWVSDGTASGTTRVGARFEGTLYDLTAVGEQLFYTGWVSGRPHHRPVVVPDRLLGLPPGRPLPGAHPVEHHDDHLDHFLVYLDHFAHPHDSASAHLWTRLRRRQPVYHRQLRGRTLPAGDAPWYRRPHLRVRAPGPLLRRAADSAQGRDAARRGVPVRA